MWIAQGEAAPRHQGWEEGQDGARLQCTRVSSLGEDAHPTLALGALPQFSLCQCFLWHEPVYIPGWTEVLSPRDLAFPSPCLACSVIASLACLLHYCVPIFLAPSPPSQLACSITVSPACLLHHVIPGLLAPSLCLLFFLERQR